MRGGLSALLFDYTDGLGNLREIEMRHVAMR